MARAGANGEQRGAVKSWERFLTLVPKGGDHDRVVALVETARSKQQTR
jgi:hypothetical protein